MLEATPPTRSKDYSQMPPALLRAGHKFIAIGKSAIAGFGLALALVGAMEIATEIMALQWLVEAKHYTDYALLVGGAVGAIAGWIWNRSE
jgi:hypothetical protein